jgi:Tfp pilus assembly protein PilF
VAPILLGACPSNGGQQNSKLAQTHYLLGSDYVKKKMPDAAKRELMRSIELDPENKDAQQLLGVIFFFEGMNKVNILERERCLKGAAASEQRGEANKDFRRCERYLLEAVRLAKKDKKTESDALNYLANVSLHFERYDEAIVRAEQALSNILYTSRHLALGTLGWAYFHKGKLAPAARELRQSIFHQPRFCVGRYRLAKVYYKQEQYTEAHAELQKVIDDKSCPIQEAHHLLGLTLMKLKKPEQAKVEFDTCVKLNPKSCISEECRRYAKLI